MLQVLVLMMLVIGIDSHEGERGQIGNTGRYGQAMTRAPMETTSKSVQPKSLLNLSKLVKKLWKS